MRVPLFIILLLGIVYAETFSQEVLWKVKVFSFFDNSEFAESEYKVPQTLSGIQIAPEIGLRWDSVHITGAGANLLHEFGSNDPVDKLYLTAYYEFNNRPFRFLMGAFPRDNVLDKYPRVFFQDSISYFRPNINGIFWEIHSEKDYFNLWLDWTSRMSETVRETFFMGFSGRYNKGMFYLQHFGYMFHYAKNQDPSTEETLHDNGLFLTSAGIDLSGRTFMDVLDINAGWAAGVERGRDENTGWIINNGLLIETRLGYKYLGIFNAFYIGRGQMTFYEDHNNELYWGDPIYRAGNYNRSDFFINFIRNSKVNVKLTYSLHLAESRVYHEQLLKVSVNINNLN
ncbi:MAG: hypothetical protein A2X04_14605 [Bacteroidetes bacterium GWF2_41_9]|nr:MAG: hypothetical protein A2X04_14605 [Bacteroidetes bacterium GWF2_41_9]HBQ82865.1 hypothetical protein [Bacteroidales bacterium]HCU19628.1 hypothetical protein [Bacteroidales bacterium]